MAVSPSVPTVDFQEEVKVRSKISGTLSIGKIDSAKNVFQANHPVDPAGNIYS